MGWKGQMCMLVVIWWAVSAAITVVMKQTVGTQGQYQFPFALTALTNGACGCISMCACYCQKGKFWANHSLRRIDVCQLLFLGVLQGVEIGMSNKSLEFLSVSARTILNSTSVFFMMLSAQFWGLERLDRLRILSAGLQVTGGFLTGLGLRRQRMSQVQMRPRRHTMLTMDTAPTLALRKVPGLPLCLSFLSAIRFLEHYCSSRPF